MTRHPNLTHPTVHSRIPIYYSPKFSRVLIMCFWLLQVGSGMCSVWVMLETMVASGQQALETSNEDTVYYDYYPPEYTHYPGQGSPELCPTVYDYGKFTNLVQKKSTRLRESEASYDRAWWSCAGPYPPKVLEEFRGASFICLGLKPRQAFS